MKAGADIAWGTQEERELREKIEQFKDEGNKIVNDIYNREFPWANPNDAINNRS